MLMLVAGVVAHSSPLGSSPLGVSTGSPGVPLSPLTSLSPLSTSRRRRRCHGALILVMMLLLVAFSLRGIVADVVHVLVGRLFLMLLVTILPSDDCRWLRQRI